MTSGHGSAEQAWEKIAREAQTYRNSTIARLSPSAPSVPSTVPTNVINLPEQLLDAHIQSITSLSPEALLLKLEKGRLTAVEVSQAFLQRAAVSQSLTNCVTELLSERALRRASELDAYLKEHGRTIGPLHGLPISVKEHLGFKDLRCTTGYVAHWDNVAKEDAHLLQVLHNAGAVFHCRTTVPQTMMIRLGYR